MTTRKSIMSVLVLAVVAVATLVLPASAQAEVRTITGTAAGPGGSRDNWNNALNWFGSIPEEDGIIPSGADSAIIGDSVFAQVDNDATPTYSGGLTLGANSRLQIGWTTDLAGNKNALGTGTITMNTGSEILSRAGLGSYTFNQPFVMAGNGTVWSGVSTANHGSTKTFAGGISGAGMLTWNGVNRTWGVISTANPSWTGGFQTADPQNQRHRFRVTADGAFGAGNVTINKNGSLYINSGLSDTIDDSAVFSLNGVASSDAIFKLVLDSNETVGALFVDGVDQGYGDFTGLTLPGIITGAGVLTVPLPAGDDIDGDGFTVAAGDWNDGDATIFPGAPELPDLKDNDGVGGVDDGLTPINTMTSDGGGSISFLLASNWSLGHMPGANDSAVISAGLSAQVTSLPFGYAGSLTLNDNATLTLNSTGGAANGAALGSAITMNNGSRITLNTTLDVPAIALAGNATIASSAHHGSRNLTGAITGTGSLTLLGNNNNTFNLNVANSFSGGLISNVSDRYHLRFKAAGSAGAGDVTVNPRSNDGRSAKLYFDAADAMADTAALFLNGGGYTGNGSQRVEMHADDTIAELWIDGVAQDSGTYTSAAPFISAGAATLTVSVGPNNPLDDLRAPVPNPERFKSGPYGLDLTSITMTATEAIDINAIEYRFKNVTDSAISAWQSGLSWTDTGLTPGQSYDYQVQAQDVLGNAGGWSAIVSTTPVIENIITGTASGPGGSSDTWNNPANWSLGNVPAGTDSAIIDAGITAKVQNAATPTFGGMLELRNNATLVISNTAGSGNVLGNSFIRMNSGSKISSSLSSMIVPSIELAGGASIDLSGQNTTTNFNGAVTGTGDLTIKGWNNHRINLNAASTFDGDLISDAVDRHYFWFNVAGAAGSGDVYVNQRGDQVTPNRSARLYFDAEGAMVETATLYLNGPAGGGGYGGNGVDWLYMNKDNTIAALYLYGVEMPIGDYTNTYSWLTGSGTLHVIGLTAPGQTWGGGDGNWSDSNWDGVGPIADTDMIVDSGMVTVAATPVAAAASLTIGGDIAGGTVNIAPTATLPVTSGVNVGDGGTLNVNGTLSMGALNVDVGGTMTLNGGSMIVSPAAADGADVTITVGGTLSGGDGVSSVGEFLVDPGWTNLTLAADSTYEQTFTFDGLSSELNVGGLDMVEGNRIDVWGSLTLGDNVRIKLVDNGGIANNEDVVLFRAAAGIDISTYSIDLPDDWTSGDLLVDLPNGLLILQNLITGAGGPLPGDANGNGVVGDADWVIFKAQFGGAPGGVDDDADFNNDGRVDLRDLAILKAAWDGGAGAPEMDATVTPEPATMSLLAIGGLLVLRRRRRKT